MLPQTGTLTTAHITVVPSMVVVLAPGLTPADVLLLAGLSSNAHNKDDPIDAALFRALEQTTAPLLGRNEQGRQTAYQGRREGGRRRPTDRPTD